MIYVYNIKFEDFSYSENNYYIGRGSILGNPYTHKQLQETMAIYHTRNREEAIERYGAYFDLMYEHNSEFKAVVDEIYEKNKKGEDVYLQCFCHPLSCHGDIIVQKLQKRLLKEKIMEEKIKRDVNNREMG
jgi:hypothetical protein